MIRLTAGLAGEDRVTGARDPSNRGRDIARLTQILLSIEECELMYQISPSRTRSVHCMHATYRDGKWKVLTIQGC